jgi:hypothetical protein
MSLYPDQITPGSGYDHPAYFDEGMFVMVPCTKAHAEAIGAGDRWSATCGIRCKVVVAAGEHARVVHERAGIDRWVSKYGCLVKVAA